MHMQEVTDNELHKKPTEYKIIQMPIDKLIFDDTNPNVMTPDQTQGLKRSFKKYGNLVPVIINQRNEIVDGAHRAATYKDWGIKQIPCFQIPLDSDVDRRELRQVMNKLRGSHDKDKDASELMILFENDKLKDLAELIAVPLKSLEFIVERQKQQLELDSNKELDFQNTKTKCPECGYEW
jgi:ParB-like chromosome segregation protein Spo0J